VRRLLAPFALLLAAGCGGSDAPPAQEAAPRPPLFAYDRAAPLDLRDRGPVNPDYPIDVRDVSYASPLSGAGRGAGRVSAFLVVPPTAGRRPAIVYAHGDGGNREQLLVQATWLAARGAVALVLSLPGAPAVEPEGWQRALDHQRAHTVATIVALRRAVDVLQSLPSVDPQRIAFVGWSSGARLGAMLAGVERRIGSYALVSGGAVPAGRYAAAAPVAMRAAVTRELGRIDPLRYVRRSAPARLLFQNGRLDEVVPQEALAGLAEAASRPKDVRWYEDMGHEATAEVYRDQIAWLADELGLGPVLVREVMTGPE
jgi:cephalosporin-C deacetylase-like acetyl esterase